MEREGWLSGISSPPSGTGDGAFVSLIDYAITVAMQAAERWQYSTEVVLVRENDGTVQARVAFLNGNHLVAQLKVGERHPDGYVWIRPRNDIENNTATLERMIRRNLSLIPDLSKLKKRL